MAALSDRYSAELVVAQLRDAGIPARIAAQVEPAWTLGSPTRVTPVEVRVAAGRAAEAHAVLDDVEGGSADAGPEGSGPDGSADSPGAA